MHGDRVVGLEASPPLAAKVLAGAHGPELLLVGAAASLVEGDRLAVHLRLGPGARLTVRTTAATLAHPCPNGGATSFSVEADLAAGARLAWLPSPLVACAGCRHTGRSRLRLAPGAAAAWAETVALGRSGEEPGEVAVRLDADLGGAPLLRDGFRAGPSVPGWSGPAGLGGRRHVASVALLGLPAPDPAAGEEAAPFPPMALAGPGAVARVVAADGAAAERAVAPWRRAFEAALHGAGRPEAVPAG